MTPPTTISALAGAREVLGWCVLHQTTLRVAATAADGTPSLAIHPAGAMPSDVRALLTLPKVRSVIARHMTAGAERFGQGDPATHSVAGTAAGFAHLAVAMLLPDQKDLFHERSAVRQYEGGMPRQQAELLALFDCLDHASAIEAVAAIHAAA